MSNADPWYYSQIWDSVLIGGAPWGPATGGGSVVIKGATRFHKIDQKDGGGLDGATQTYRGRKPKPFKILFRMWAQQHWLLWVTYSQLFNYNAIVGAVPYSIAHPSLQVLGINDVICEEVGSVEVDEQSKMATATVTFRQFLPPPLINATNTPPAAAAVPPTIPGVPPNPAIAALQARISQLNAQIAAEGAPGGLP